MSFSDWMKEVAISPSPELKAPFLVPPFPMETTRAAPIALPQSCLALAACLLVRKTMLRRSLRAFCNIARNTRASSRSA
eukprot:Skav203568  [mRNA]  locus=scaffold3576:235786:237869:- [translate_table: standard]